MIFFITSSILITQFLEIGVAIISIDISDIKRMDDAGIEEVARRIQAEFDRLDAEVVPYQKAKAPNILWRVLRLLAFVPAAIIGLLTILFSFLASFVWDPDKHKK